jgi:23S rRNA (uracil1939-C5)-methyltransferase
MNFRKNDITELTITGITSEGNGVGKLDGYAVFVPQTVIGDIVSVKLVKVGKSFGYGIVMDILHPSENRIAPDCESFKKCGGCSFRHMSYGEELRVKKSFILDSFRKIAHIDLPSLDISYGVTENYRNKAQYPLAIADNGEVTFGFYARNSHRVCTAKNCKLQPPIFAEIAETIADFLTKEKIPVYNETTAKGTARHIYIRQGHYSKQIMACIVVKDWLSPETAESFKACLLNKFDIKHIVQNKNSENTNVILGTENRTIHGTNIEDVMCGNTIELSASAFYQVNTPMAEKLYAKAEEFVANTGENARLLDLYCGTGTIGLSLARKVQSVTGIDCVEESIENARKNALRNDINNAEFHCADLATYTLKKHENTDIIVVDPPRKGLDNTVIEAIQLISPRKIVMISCNPATAARDCGLLASGYKLQNIVPFDLFPRTTHVECAIELVKF